MPRVPAASVSNTQADRAGSFWRHFWSLTPEERRQAKLMKDALGAINIVNRYRALHAYPLRKVTMGVRQMIQTELGANSAPRPGQRFKRLDRILDKLFRYPHMRLSQMEDIGGCRAVFETLDELEAVAGRIRRRWPHAHVDDYIAEPKPDGYRSLHIIERRDGRLIEVQLRTAAQQAWAEAIEAAAPVVGFNLKDGEGPDDLRRYFAMAAERLALSDRGERQDPALEREFATLREQVRDYFDARTA